MISNNFRRFAMKTRNDVTFDKGSKIIKFNGTVIIDLGPVAGKAKARLYSRLEKDTHGYATVFSIRNTEKPFDFGFLSLSTEGFVTAAIENRVEIEGMLVNEGLEDAYKHIRSPKRNRNE
jgi:hypothetical protein